MKIFRKRKALKYIEDCRKYFNLSMGTKIILRTIERILRGETND